MSKNKGVMIMTLSKEEMDKLAKSVHSIWVRRMGGAENTGGMRSAQRAVEDVLEAMKTSELEILLKK